MNASQLVLGGTFDPPHLAHFALLEAAGNALGIAERRLLIAADPYQKSHRVSPAAQRLAMLELALAQSETADPRLPASHCAIDSRELKRHAQNGKPSYTIDSLREMRAELGADACIVFVLGWDQWLSLPAWHQWRELLDVAHLCVAPRATNYGQALGAPSAELEAYSRFKFASEHALREKPCGLIYQLPQFAIDLSSTQLRSAIARGDHGEAMKHLALPVLRYISDHKLYQN